jgi:hypothetical protein
MSWQHVVIMYGWGWFNFGIALMVGAMLWRRP